MTTSHSVVYWPCSVARPSGRVCSSGDAEDDERPQEAVPAGHEREDRRAVASAGRTRRDDDREEDPEVARAVEGGGLVELARHRLDRLPEQEDPEGGARTVGSSATRVGVLRASSPGTRRTAAPPAPAAGSSSSRGRGAKTTGFARGTAAARTRTPAIEPVISCSARGDDGDEQAELQDDPRHRHAREEREVRVEGRVAGTASACGEPVGVIEVMTVHRNGNNITSAPSDDHHVRARRSAGPRAPCHPEQGRRRARRVRHSEPTSAGPQSWTSV